MKRSDVLDQLDTDMKMVSKYADAFTVTITITGTDTNGDIFADCCGVFKVVE